MKKKGFTLIEILVISAMAIVLGAFVLPISVSVYNMQISRSVSDDIYSTLKKAQSYSQFRRQNSEFGVFFDQDNDRYILFKGSEYNTNDPNNEEYNLYGAKLSFEPEVSGDIIYFSLGEGHPNATTTVTINRANLPKFISICDFGFIEFGVDNCAIADP